MPKAQVNELHIEVPYNPKIQFFIELIKAFSPIVIWLHEINKVIAKFVLVS